MPELRVKEIIKSLRQNHFKEQEQFRCKKCNKLLAKSNDKGDIMCCGKGKGKKKK